MFAGQFPNPLLLAIILHKKRRYGMLEYYQFWLENIRLQRYEVLINKIWGKKIQNGTFEYLLNTIRPGIEKCGFSTGIVYRTKEPFENP